MCSCLLDAEDVTIIRYTFRANHEWHQIRIYNSSFAKRRLTCRSFRPHLYQPQSSKFETRVGGWWYLLAQDFDLVFERILLAFEGLLVDALDRDQVARVDPVLGHVHLREGAAASRPVSRELDELDYTIIDWQPILTFRANLGICTFYRCLGETRTLC